MKTFKKLAEVILTVIACGAFILMMSEANNAHYQILVTGGSAAVIYVCYRLLERLGAFNDNI